jgi:hypothetical protein
MFSTRFDKTFRNVGVTTFFRARQQSRSDLADNVRSVFEHELFQEWVEGGRSVQQIRSIIFALRRRFETRREKLESSINGLQTALDTAQEEVARIETVASRVSWLGQVVLKQRERILAQYDRPGCLDSFRGGIS